MKFWKISVHCFSRTAYLRSRRGNWTVDQETAWGPLSGIGPLLLFTHIFKFKADCCRYAPSLLLHRDSLKFPIVFLGSSFCGTFRTSNRSLCNSIKTSSVVSGRVLQPGNYTLKGPVSPQLWHLFPDGGSVEPGLTSPDSFFLNNKAVTTCCTSVMGFLHIWLLA